MLIAEFSSDYGAEIEWLSAKHTMQDHEYGGPTHMVKNGFGSIVDALVKEISERKVKIMMNTPITKVVHGENGKKAEVHCADGSVVEGDRVVVTVPLGVLKSGKIAFEPPLPEWKQKAIERMQLAYMDKLILEFDEAFWGDESLWLIYFNNEAKRGRWMYTFNLFKFIGKPVLVMLNHGQSCLDLKDLSDQEVIDDAMGEFKTMFGKEEVEKRTLKSYIRTNWTKDPFIGHTWAFVGIGGDLSDCDVLRKQVDSQLYFAGEATYAEFIGMTHGAYMSGRMTAQDIID